MKRIITLTLAMLLAIGCLAACGEPDADVNASGTDISAETANPEVSADPEAATTYTTFDYEAAYNAYNPDEVVLTVNGDEVTWQEYFGWLFSIIEQYEMYMGTEFGWDDLFSETQTMDEYARFYAETMCAQYSVVAALADEKGIELSDEEKQYIEDLMASDAETYAGGSIEDFIKFLEATYMSEEYYRFINSVAIYYQSLFEKEFGENGEMLSDADVEDFIETNSYLYAKHILFLTVDDAGTALDDAVKAEKLAQAEDVIAQLNAITGPEEKLAKFDELMNSLSEDTGLTAYPDGYYFLPGEMVTEFEEGTKALEFNGISDIIESPYGYHIILRLPITPDSEYQEGTSFRSLAAAYAFDTMMSEAFSAAEIVYNDTFASLKLGDIFTTIEVEY